PATAPAAAPAATPPAAVPKPTPTGCAPFSPLMGSRFASGAFVVVRLLAIGHILLLVLSPIRGGQRTQRTCRGDIGKLRQRRRRGGPPRPGGGGPATKARGGYRSRLFGGGGRGSGTRGRLKPGGAGCPAPAPPPPSFPPRAGPERPRVAFLAPAVSGMTVAL